MTHRFALTLIALLFAARPAAADEVRLMNGDRITGRVVSLSGGMLTLATPNGDLRIPWASVTALAVDEPILASIGAADPSLVTVAVAPDAGVVTLQPGGAVPLQDILVLARPDAPLRVNGSANAGFVSSAGNTDIHNVHVDGDLVARAAANRYTVSAVVNRAADRGVESARNWSTALKYDRFVSTRLFLNGNAIFANDRFRDLRLRTALGAGVGYQILQTSRATRTADAGLGWVNEDLAAGNDPRYAAARESAALTLELVPQLIDLFHQHDGYFGVTGDNNLFVRTQNGIRLRLVAGFVTTLRYDLDYDRSPAPGRRNTDRTLALTLGYRF